MRDTHLHRLICERNRKLELRRQLFEEIGKLNEEINMIRGINPGNTAKGINNDSRQR